MPEKEGFQPGAEDDKKPPVDLTGKIPLPQGKLDPFKVEIGGRRPEVVEKKIQRMNEKDTDPNLKLNAEQMLEQRFEAAQSIGDMYKILDSVDKVPTSLREKFPDGMPSETIVWNMTRLVSAHLHGEPVRFNLIPSAYGIRRNFRRLLEKEGPLGEGKTKI